MSKKVEELILRGNREINEMQDQHSYYTRMGVQRRGQEKVHNASSRLNAPQANSGHSGVPDRLPSANPPVTADVLPTTAQSVDNAAERRTGSSEVSSEGKISREEKKKTATALYLQGEELPSIAEHTGLSLGEVELIVALIRR
jgi:hypothetical protein